VNGFILAGGRSTRMGQDKALLHYAGRPLVEHAVKLLHAAGLVPHIVGVRPDLAAYAPVVEDLHPDCGPLGGMEAALLVSTSERSVFVPVDVPLLPPAFLQYLVERAVFTGAIATLPTLAGRFHPLCAVYHRDLLSGITGALQAGDYKVMHIIENLPNVDFFRVECVAAARNDWPVQPPLHLWFQNLNTPEDMALIS
jgi:molybdopterin-guanine dinucleotide biosynthesis protein A